jgi:mRNA interferase MazF
VALKRGGIYLANFNPSRGTEPGKIRPCVVIQTDLLNDEEHPSTTVLPLTTQLIDQAAPLRFRISARDGVRQDSDVMVDQLRTIDNRRIQGEQLTRLTAAEFAEIEVWVKIVLGLSD